MYQSKLKVFFFLMLCDGKYKTVQFSLLNYIILKNLWHDLVKINIVTSCVSSS